MNAGYCIPQNDPHAGYIAHKDEIDNAIARVLEGGQYILGGEVRAFEREYAAYIGVQFAIGVGSGTDALEIALRAAGVGAGDYVFTVSHTAVATVAAIERAGASPVFVDVDPLTYTMDPNHLKDMIARVFQRNSFPGKGRPKAIIPVHLYGYPADISSIVDIARQYELLVIEDCAQSHGAMYNEKKTGSWGEMAAFSFYPTKNLGAFGDGGAVLTDNAGMAERAFALREYGWDSDRVSRLPGVNSRLDEIQAALLRAKLPYLDFENSRRRELAELYSSMLRHSDLMLPCTSPKCREVFHQYVVRSKKRDALRSHLKEAGIFTGIHYPIPVHRQPAYSNRPLTVVPLAVTEQIVEEILSLPMYPQLQNCQAEYVSTEIMQWLEDDR
ncbi:MAG TPA: DegT/DnrJ/EryC1/StrS family aminotransferase [bacterium]|nr:DegT/DnrJ/EryC1/StrS family aminotransferase [bacterium]